MTEREIFFEALEITRADARAAYLQGACGKDVTLRRKVDELLKEHFANDSLLSKPAVDSAPTVLGDTQITEGPGAQIGRYKLLQKLGEGGFGVVYMAEQKEPVKRRVALKIIKLGMDTGQVVARFEAERQALAMMDHPNIAKVLDAGATDTGRPFFVMELVKGVPITRYCDDNNLSMQERLGLFIPVCHAIQHAHQKGIIHRDIKPSNVMVTLHDGVPVPKVIDFGIAKATQQELTEKTIFTQYSQFIGTPAYMSPEQAEMSGLDIDTRSDIYSLGVLLYELLVGRTPLDGKELMSGGYDEIRRRIKEEEPPKPSTRVNTLEGAEKTTVARHRKVGPEQLSSELRGDLDWIVLKALEKDRTRRYETANGFALDIKRFLANEPVAAVPPSSGYLLKKYARRHRGALAVAAAIAGLLVAGITMSTWQAVRATRAQAAAEKAQAAELEQKLLAQTQQKKAEVERSRAETEHERAETQAHKASASEQQSRRFLYAADMNLAQQSLKLNNLGRARRLLERHRPQPGEEDLRGWEWRYLWQLTRSSELVTLTNRPTRGFSVSFSPDGTRLAMGWGDGRVDLWDVPGRRQIRALADRGNLNPAHVAFSPIRNLLAATSESKVVTLYDFDSGRESILWRAPEQGAWEVRDLEFSQDGSRMAIYAASSRELGDAAWVVNVSSSEVESRHSTLYSGSSSLFGAARLSSDNQRLYLSRGDSIHCLDLATGQELWQSEPQRDEGLTALAISPDGRVLTSGSGFEDPAIRVWDAATGQLIRQLNEHTSWVCDLAFTRDGRRLISAAADQTIRFWDTSTWSETKVLRGHTDEIPAVAISETAQLVASASKDGELKLWRNDGKSATDGYRRFPENIGNYDVGLEDHSRVLLLTSSSPPAWIDLKRDSPPVSLPELGSSTYSWWGWYGTNTLCHWNGTNQIVVHELRNAEFIRLGAIALASGMRPTGFTYNPKRQLLAWSEGTNSASIYLASLAAPGRRIELKSDAPGLVPHRFSEDGTYLAAWFHGRPWPDTKDTLRVWNVDAGQIVASIDEGVYGAIFTADERVLVTSIVQGDNHEIRFYDLIRTNQAPRRFPGKYFSFELAVSPDGGLVASGTGGGEVRFFNPIKNELIESVHGHSGAAASIAFSGDGRRLISAAGGREAVKLWDVSTRQELLTLAGAGGYLGQARWSADGDVILAGAPWQAWRAPSWEEIAATEAQDKSEGKAP